ncbi:MAG: phosphoribosylformylglycinamidine synthase, partial [Muribaculaceae bacterium]|nr:phosphoribosylformylglycinamidine synthase [Muribaculaceae bacterium]
MKPYRIFVEKREPYRVEADSLRDELNSNLGLDISSLRLICVYDLFGFTPELVEKSSFKVFGEPATDNVSDHIDFEGRPFLAVESLPGQFDQRAAAAVDCVKLIQPDADIDIRSAKLMIFDSSVGEKEMKKIAGYCINAVESREKDLSILAAPERAQAKPVAVLEGFRDITADKAADWCKENGLAM